MSFVKKISNDAYFSLEGKGSIMFAKCILKTKHSQAKANSSNDLLLFALAQQNSATEHI